MNATTLTISIGHKLQKFKLRLVISFLPPLLRTKEIEVEQYFINWC